MSTEQSGPGIEFSNYSEGVTGMSDSVSDFEYARNGVTLENDLPGAVTAQLQLNGWSVRTSRVRLSRKIWYKVSQQGTPFSAHA